MASVRTKLLWKLCYSETRGTAWPHFLRQLPVAPSCCHCSWEIVPSMCQWKWWTTSIPCWSSRYLFKGWSHTRRLLFTHSTNFEAFHYDILNIRIFWGVRLWEVLDASTNPSAIIFRTKQSGKNKAIHTFEISGTTHPKRQRQIQENRKLRQHYSQKLKSRKRCSSLLCNLLQKRAADIPPASL